MQEGNPCLMPPLAEYKVLGTLLENVTDEYCLALCDEKFDYFPLFDESLRHMELCNSVIDQIHTAKSAKTFLTVYI